MRVLYPDYIYDFCDKAEPYMEYTEGSGWALKADAPEEIIEARRRIDEFNKSLYEEL